MMKRIMYGSVSILCLSLAFHLGALSARSTYVDHMSTGIIALSREPAPNRVLGEDGVVWSADEDPAWGWQVDTSIPPLPVPVSQVKFWAVDTFVTFSNEVWRVGGGAWQSAGYWPGGTSPAESTSWGEIKARFRGDSSSEQ